MSFDLDSLDQIFKENCNLYLMSEPNCNISNKEELYIDAISQFEENLHFPSFNLLEEDLNTDRSKLFTRNLFEENGYSSGKREGIAKLDNFDKKCTLISSETRKIFSIQKMKRDKSSGLYQEIKCKKFEEVKELKTKEIYSKCKTKDNSDIVPKTGDFKFKLNSISQIKNCRFGRDQDKVYFSDLKRICKQRNIKMSEFAINYESLRVDLKEIIKTFLNQCEWKGTCKDLHRRIFKLLTSPFSVREIKILKKMIKKQSKNKTIKYDKIAYHLPGKSIKAIKNQCAKLGLLSRKRIKKSD